MRILPAKSLVVGLFTALMVTPLVVLSAPRLSAQEKVPTAADTPLLQACQRLLNKEVNQKEWREVLAFAHNLKRAVDAKLPFQPYEEAIDLNSLAELPNAEPGRPTLLSSVRYASKQPPGPGESFIHTSAVYVDGDLTAVTPNGPAIDAKGQPKPYDGYFSDSVVVVNGRIRTTSYIYNSIVIAAGPIELEGYIHNSLVISLDGLPAHQGEASVPLESAPKTDRQATVRVNDGYISNSVVIGAVACEDLRDSVILGESIGREADLRGAEIFTAGGVARLPWEIGKLEKQE